VKLVLKFEQMKKGIVGIVGTGPAALMAGTILVDNGFEVQFFDQKKAAARKFLVAGHGGFNLTNSEEIESFCLKYDQELIRKAVNEYSPADFINFLQTIGIETYCGSSGKIFPKKGTKPIEVLNAWLNYLIVKGTAFNYEHKLIDFDQTNLTFKYKSDIRIVSFDAVIFALGGASWKQTGSLGDWIDLVEKKKVKCNPFESSNSGLILNDLLLVPELEGTYIKNCCLFSSEFSKQGDIVLTNYGIEGAPAYAMNRDFRNGNTIYIDFKPSLMELDIVKRLRKSKNTSDGLKNLRLSKIAVNWIKSAVSKEVYLDAEQLAKHIKSFELPVVGLRPIDEVISTVGGIDMNELDNTFQLNKLPKVYCVGEMLDWDAPTGGFLIQGAVSSGAKAANAIVNLDRCAED
jgi:uncharacterized flavoprotein (TIGR03862 family)